MKIHCDIEQKKFICLFCYRWNLRIFTGKLLRICLPNQTINVKWNYYTLKVTEDGVNNGRIFYKPKTCFWRLLWNVKWRLTSLRVSGCSFLITWAFTVSKTIIQSCNRSHWKCVYYELWGGEAGRQRSKHFHAVAMQDLARTDKSRLKTRSISLVSMNSSTLREVFSLCQF